MSKFRRIFLSAAALCLLAPAASAKDPLAAMMAGESAIQGKKLDKAIQKASAHPFGSAKNPVRAHFPPGQRAYLDRLRCADGNAPKYRRMGSAGASPYQNIMDIYDVDCGDAEPGKQSIHIDMYHKGHVEAEAVPGFTITAP